MNGVFEIIADDDGLQKIPSYVAFNDVERLIGNEAKHQFFMNPAGTVRNFNRLIDRKYDDPIIVKNEKYMSFAIENFSGEIKIGIRHRGKVVEYFPYEITAMILEKLKQMAEKHLNKEVTDAVITVPTYFSYIQRQTIKDAATLAGLNALRILSVTNAAVMSSYCFNRKTNEKQNVLVCDLGGGSFNVSIVTIYNFMCVKKATNGSTIVGGEDFKWNLLQYCVEQIETATG